MELAIEALMCSRTEMSWSRTLQQTLGVDGFEMALGRDFWLEGMLSRSKLKDPR